MTTVITFFVLVISSICFAAKPIKIPPNFPSCHRYDPKINECLLKATDAMKPLLRKGIPELGIPSFETFKIPEIILQQGTSALNFKATLTDVVATGLTDYKFSKFDMDVPKLLFNVDAVIGEVTLAGKYVVNGKVLLAPIVGNGNFVAAIDHCKVHMDQKFEVIKKNGVEYITPVSTNTSIEVGGPKAKLDGLFGGDKALSEATNRAINDNVNELFEELKPVIEKIITDIVTKALINVIVGKIPFDTLYPPIK